MKHSNTKHITATSNNKPVQKTIGYSTNQNTERSQSHTKNIFSNVDLWNIQKQVKYACARRRVHSMLN